MAVLFALSVAASVWTLRRLGLPWWWITWPPLVDNLWNGNPQLFLVPLLIGGAAWLAPIVKAYAIVPLIIQLRFRAVLITAAIVLVTAPFLPWGLWSVGCRRRRRCCRNSRRAGCRRGSFRCSCRSRSIALIAMGRQRASWWFIPALWPSTQWYYSLMAMPALTPLTAAILAAPVQGGPAVAAIVAALEIWWRARRSSSPPAQTAAATSDGRTAAAPSS